MQHLSENIKAGVNFGASLLLSITGSQIANINTFTIPTIVMQCFQLFAWSGSGILGIITIYKFFKNKKHGNKN